MAKIAFKSDNQGQLQLLPPSLDELIPATHPVRVLNNIVDRLDVGKVLASYKGGGNSCFHPRMMLKVLIYAYLNNIYSSRKIERQLHEHIHYMWLSGGGRPDFRTINYFRGKRLKDSFDDIFTRVVEFLHSEGFVSLEVQYIDGTKIESAANKYTFVWRGSIEKYDSRLREKTRRILSDAEKVLEMESHETPPDEELSVEEFRARTSRIQEKMYNREVPKQIRKAVEKTAKESIPKMLEYERALDIMGERNSYSKTDESATFMRMKEDAMKNGQLKPGYNIQIATENQFITNYAVYHRPTDTLTLIPFLESFEKRYGRQSNVVVADSGYGSEQNYEYLFGPNLIPYVKYNMFHQEQKRKYKKNAFLVQNLFYNPKGNYYVCPMGQYLFFIREEKRKSDAGYISQVSIYRAAKCLGCPVRGLCNKAMGNRQIEVNHTLNRYKEKIRYMLNSEEWIFHRKKRPVEPEAVFADIKEAGKFRRFRLRGINGVGIEFGLKAIAHNIKKIAACRGKYGFGWDNLQKVISNYAKNPFLKHEGSLRVA